MKRTNQVLALVAALAVAAPTVARAAEETSTSSASGSRDSAHSPGGLLDRSTHTRPQMLTAWALFPWYYGWGIGGGLRYTLPLIHDGFIKPVNDSFELEFGADLFYGNYGVGLGDDDYLGIIVPVGVRWTFHFSPTFAAYAKLSLGFQYRYFPDETARRWVDYGFFDYVHWDPEIGLLWKFAEKMSLRAEVGYTGARVGVGFAF